MIRGVHVLDPLGGRVNHLEILTAAHVKGSCGELGNPRNLGIY